MSRANYTLIQVEGNSMRPFLRAGDLGLLIPTADVGVGDIVCAKLGQSTVVHRVVNVSDGCLVLCGDNCVGVDEVAHGDVLGRVSAWIRNDRIVNIQRSQLLRWVAAWRYWVVRSHWWDKHPVLYWLFYRNGFGQQIRETVPRICRYSMERRGATNDVLNSASVGDSVRR
jgi:hypothetical protein